MEKNQATAALLYESNDLLLNVVCSTIALLEASNKYTQAVLSYCDHCPDEHTKLLLLKAVKNACAPQAILRTRPAIQKQLDITKSFTEKTIQQ